MPPRPRLPHKDPPQRAEAVSWSSGVHVSKSQTEPTCEAAHTLARNSPGSSVGVLRHGP